MSEHSLKSPEVEHTILDGYVNVTTYCRPSLGMGGVGIWTKTEITSEVLNVAEFCIEGYCELAATLIKLKDNKKLLLVVGYRPPTNQCDVFFETLSSCLEKNMRKNCTTVVAGDFNIDLSKDSFLKHKFVTIMATFGLKNLVTSYTRECLNSRTLIDHIFSDDHTIKTEVVVSALSDHHAQTAVIPHQSTAKPIPLKYRYGRIFSKGNKQLLRNILNKEEWTDM